MLARNSAAGSLSWRLASGGYIDWLSQEKQLTWTLNKNMGLTIFDSLSTFQNHIESLLWKLPESEEDVKATALLNHQLSIEHEKNLCQKGGKQLKHRVCSMDHLYLSRLLALTSSIFLMLAVLVASLKQWRMTRSCVKPLLCRGAILKFKPLGDTTYALYISIHCLYMPFTLDILSILN